MSASARTVAIIGGGYAGMTAAVELASHGVAVDVFEAAEALGGRARRVDAQDHALDNGLHILIGAYRETLRLIEHVRDPGEDAGLRRMPLELEVHGRFRMKAARLPHPLNVAFALLGATGLGTRDKIAIALLLNWLKSRGFKLPSDISVEQLLRERRQTTQANRHLWFPLCTAALNTLPHEASARIFCNVLRDTFSPPARNSDFLLPATDLSRLFPDRAARYIKRRAGKVHTGARVLCVTSREGHTDVTTRGGSQQYACAIVAVAPQHVEALIEVNRATEALAALEYRPIHSVYLGYPRSTRLPKPMLGLDASLTQWVFDRGQLCGQPGVMGVVISASGAHQDLPHSELAARVHDELRGAIPDLGSPLWHQVIAEKRATFACTPGLLRPDADTGIPGIFLAGDYLDADYPATLESAVRSGVRAARLAMEHR